MTEETRKRLEEAAMDFRGWFLGSMNTYQELRGKEPYSADNEIMDACLDATELGYKAGAEYGYKEAIAWAKEWLEKKAHFAEAQYCNCEESEDDYYNGKVYGLEEALADFEADMNKLWED